MRKNWQSLLIAFIMAVSLWYMVAGREPMDAWTTAHVVLSSVPEDLLIVDGLEPSVAVRVRAPTALLRTLADQLVAYPLDLSELYVGENIIHIDPSKFTLGSAFEVIEIRPTRLQLIVDRLTVRELPVAATFKNALPTDIDASVESVEPPSVLVRGPQSVLDTLHTAPAGINIDTFPEGGPFDEVRTLPAALELPDGLESDDVLLTAQVRIALKTRSISVYRDVHITGASGQQVSLKPERVRVDLQMPASERLDSERSKQVRAVIRVPENKFFQNKSAAGKKSDGTAPSGKHEASPKSLLLPFRVHLPDGVWLQGTDPERVRVTVTP